MYSIKPLSVSLLPLPLVQTFAASNSMATLETTGRKHFRSLDPPHGGAVKSFHDHRSLIYIEDVSVYECDPPLGPLRENFYDDDESPTGVVCYNNIATCCGPLLNFTSCPDASTDPWPGGFVDGVCSGYSAFECCYAEDGYTVWKFSACYESQEKILANWDNNTNSCTSTSVSNCCGTLQEYTSCPGSSQRFPGKWNGDVCSGYFTSDCCFVEDYVTSYNFIACYGNQEMIEGQWSDGDCYAPLLSQCCSDLQKNDTFPSNGFVYTCEPPSVPIEENWFIDTASSSGRVCDSNNGTCCRQLLDFTDCPNSSKLPGAFTNGVCTGFSDSDCCYTEDGSKSWTFHSCNEGQGKVRAYWVGDSCVATSLSKCCGTRQDFKSCPNSTFQTPDGWNDGVCFGYAVSDCCLRENGKTLYNFSSCPQSQEKIPGLWKGNNCTAHSLSHCCQPNGNDSNSTGTMIGSIIGGLFVSAFLVIIFMYNMRRRKKSGNVSMPLSASKMKVLSTDESQSPSNDFEPSPNESTSQCSNIVYESDVPGVLYKDQCRDAINPPRPTPPITDSFVASALAAPVTEAPGLLMYKDQCRNAMAPFDSPRVEGEPALPVVHVAYQANDLAAYEESDSIPLVLAVEVAQTASMAFPLP